MKIFQTCFTNYFTQNVKILFVADIQSYVHVLFCANYM